MSKRNEIIDGSYAANSKNGLINNEVLEWVDLGHAQGNVAIATRDGSFIQSGKSDLIL